MTAAAYRAALATAMGLEVERFHAAGTTVVPGEDRRGERLVSLYHVGRHAVIWTDPDLAPVLACWSRPTDTTTADEFHAAATRAGASPLGLGLEHVLPGGVARPRVAGSIEVVDGSADAGRARVAALLAACGELDRDEAEFDLDDLDPYLAAWSDDGELVALAGARPFAARPGFWDIGVIVRPDSRRSGRGRAVVAAVVDQLQVAGLPPVYRCAATNAGSQRLCRGLGFVEVVRLVAYRWDGDTP